MGSNRSDSGWVEPRGVNVLGQVGLRFMNKTNLINSLKKFIFPTHIQSTVKWDLIHIIMLISNARLMLIRSPNHIKPNHVKTNRIKKNYFLIGKVDFLQFPLTFKELFADKHTFYSLDNNKLEKSQIVPYIY